MMQAQNYSRNNENNLRRSTVYESHPLQHHQVNSQQRPSVLKRSSYTFNHQNNHSAEFSNFSNNSTISCLEQNLPPNLYYHQSSYQAYPISQPLSNRTSYQQKNQILSGSRKSVDLDEKMKEITNKLNSTINLVEKHEKILQSKQKTQNDINGMITPEIRAVIEGEIERNVKAMQKSFSLPQIRSEIDTLRTSLKEIPSKIEINSQMNKIELNINKAISQISENLLLQFEELNKSRKKEQDELIRTINKKMKKVFDENIKVWEQRRKEKTEEDQTSTSSQDNNCSVAKKTFIGDPILMRMENIFSVKMGNKYIRIEMQENIYRIDEDGFLLDSDHAYILDGKNEQIRLSREQIQKLKDYKMLK